jgi:hypothetical protein
MNAFVRLCRDSRCPRDSYHKAIRVLGVLISSTVCGNDSKFIRHSWSFCQGTARALFTIIVINSSITIAHPLPELATCTITTLPEFLWAFW